MFFSTKHVHFVGIGGIGMSALAKWFLHDGSAVSGSDVHESRITRDLAARGAKVTIGHDAANVAADVDLLVYTPAAPVDNVERKAARERSIREVSNFEYLGELSKSFSTIVVCGTNGKSTTTAMLGLILEAAGYDPTVLVGSFVPSFPDGNLRVGKSRFFVIEGCEYRANMLHLEPEMIVLTNIEEDHLDFYRDLTHIQATFQQFVDKLRGKGIVVMNGDDPDSQALRVDRAVHFGSDRTLNVYTYLERMVGIGEQNIKTNVGEFTLRIPGAFNVMNAMAATAAAMELGVPFETCARTLAVFPGLWRRFERLGVWRGAQLITDYGHHPTAVRQTLEAASEFFPGRRIVLCYQPHQHDRTRKLFDGFVNTLSLADVLIVSEIYDVAGRNEVHNISSRDLVEVIAKQSATCPVEYAADLVDAQKRLESTVREGDVVIVMGAGDIDEMARVLV